METNLDNRRDGARAVTRRTTMVDLIASQQVSSQAELADHLSQRGFNVTQATLSRDLKALGIGKVPAADHGYVYVLPNHSVETEETSMTSGSLGAFVREVKCVGNLVLVRTPRGAAKGVARALDDMDVEGVAGTVSGDDTVMVVTASTIEAERVRNRLNQIVGASA